MISGAGEADFKKKMERKVKVLVKVLASMQIILTQSVIKSMDYWQVLWPRLGSFVVMEVIETVGADDGWSCRELKEGLKPIEVVNKIHPILKTKTQLESLRPRYKSSMATGKGKSLVKKEDSDGSSDYQNQNTLPTSEIENLASSFSRKIILPIKIAPLVDKTPLMNKAREEAYQSSVVFRFVDVILASSTVKTHIAKTWVGMDFECPFALSAELFQAKFDNIMDVQKVLANQPWILADHIMQVVPWREYNQRGKEAFKVFSVWFQMPQMPPKFVEEEVLEEMLVTSGLFRPSQIKKFELYYGNKEDERAVRIKVELERDVPLPPGIRTRDDGKEFTVPFIYEFIHMLCFRCGMIGHHQAKCQIPEHQASKLYSQKNRVLSSYPIPNPTHRSLSQSLLSIKKDIKLIKKEIKGDIQSSEGMQVDNIIGTEIVSGESSTGINLSSPKIPTIPGSVSVASSLDKGKNIVAEFESKISMDKGKSAQMEEKIVFGSFKQPNVGIKIQEGQNEYARKNNFIKPQTELESYQMGSESNWASRIRFEALKKHGSVANFQRRNEIEDTKEAEKTIGQRVADRIWRNRQCITTKKRGLNSNSIVDFKPKKAVAKTGVVWTLSTDDKGFKSWKKAKTNAEEATQDLSIAALSLLQECYNDPLIREVVDAEVKRTGLQQSSKKI